jgi:hypothetical protein
MNPNSDFHCRLLQLTDYCADPEEFREKGWGGYLQISDKKKTSPVFRGGLGGLTFLTENYTVFKA